jgi:hypothetical protein
MKKKHRIYQPRVFDSRVIMPDEIERIHKDLLQFERIGRFGVNALGDKSDVNLI